LVLLLVVSQCAVARLVISEVHYVGDKDAETDFVEVHNASPNASHALANASLSTGAAAAFRFPSNAAPLMPGTYAIVCQSVVKCTANFSLPSTARVFGPLTALLNAEHDRVRLTDAAGITTELSYRFGFPWPAPVRGVESIQLVNASLSEALAETASLWRAAVPTPLAAPPASVALPLDRLPPVVDDAVHVVDFEARSAAVALTVRYSGVVVVSIFFQHVRPGAYIRQTDAAFVADWTMLTANDAGTDGDRVANDHVYTARCPPSMVTARSVVRWRAQVNYEGGVNLWPSAGDVRNWAFYVYPARVPAYVGAVDPSGASGSEQATRRTVELADAEPTSVIHVIANEQDVWDGLWMHKSNLATAPPDEFRHVATLVIDGRVHDHVRWRCRGQAGRFAAGKNAWKFKLNRGDFARLRQDGPRARAVPTQRIETLNLDAMFLNLMSGWKREYEPLGTHGLPQMMTARLFELAQVPSLWMSLVQLRVVIYGNESASDQYATDFWGMYLAFEEPDDRYVERHALPDGSVYKMQNPPEPISVAYRARGQPDDASDPLQVLAQLRQSQTQQWAYDNLDMPLYYRWRAVASAAGHLDIGRGKNWLFYRPAAGPDQRVKLLPWDFDRTYVNSLVQDDRWNQTLKHPRIALEFHAALSSFHQLYCNASDHLRLLDEMSRRVWDDGRAHHWADAERLRWDFSPDLERMPMQAHPFQASPQGERRPAPKGHFYLRANDVPGQVGAQLRMNIDNIFLVERAQTALFTGTFKRMVSDYLSRVVRYHCDAIALLYIPRNVNTPPAPLSAPTAAGAAGRTTAVDQLRFTIDGAPTSALVSLQWQLAAVHGPTVPGATFVAGDRHQYELTPLYTGVGPQFAAPIDLSLVGKVLRVRARLLATNGTASAWSPPLEFTATPPADAALPLIVSEVMFHAPFSSADDYVELYNPSAVERSLRGVRLDGDARYRFADTDKLPPLTALVLARNATSFRARYGVEPLNGADRPLNGSLSNAGGTLELKDISGALMDRVAFDSRIPLQAVLADGLGFSLERVPGGALASAWRLSPIGGTPGRHDAQPSSAAAVARSPLVVSEVMSAPSDLLSDWVELQNVGAAAIDFESETWHVTDDVRANATRYRLRGSLAPNKFRVVSRAELGFGFGSDGDEVYVLRIGAGGQPTGAIHGFRFGAVPRGLSVGRHETADKTEHLGVVLAVPTPGFENSYPAASPLAISAFAIDLREQRADSRLRHDRDGFGAQPTRSAYVELISADGVQLAGTTPTGETARWCLRGCRYSYCFDGERRGKRALVSEARTLWFRATPRDLTGAELGGPAVADGEGLADSDNVNAWTQEASDPCTRGGLDTSVRLERRLSTGVDEVRERVDFAALARLGVDAKTSLEARGPVRFVRHSAAVFAGDLAAWKVAPFATVSGNDVWPRCTGTDLAPCVSPSACVVAVACERGACVYAPKACPAPTNNCSVSFCSEQTQGCAERLVDFATADKVAIGLSPLCAVDPSALAAARCGNGVIEAGEVCDGELCCESTCKALKPENALCRAAPIDQATCALPTRCTGKSASCPPAAVQAAGAVCRPANATLPCDVAEQCDGTSGLCPSDASRPFMATCTLPATALGSCRSDARCTNLGACSALFTCNCTDTPTVCDTGDACWRGECVGGRCTRTFSPAGTACDDGNACTVGDVCSAAGVCSGSAGQSCAGNCSGRGRCCAAVCLCEPGWRGDACQTADDMMGVTLPPVPISEAPDANSDDDFFAIFKTPWILYATIGAGGGLLCLCCLAVVFIVVVCNRKKKKKRRRVDNANATPLYRYESSRRFQDEREAPAPLSVPPAQHMYSTTASSNVFASSASPAQQPMFSTMASSNMFSSSTPAAQPAFNTMSSNLFTSGAAQLPPPIYPSTTLTPSVAADVAGTAAPHVPSVFSGGGETLDRSFQDDQNFGDLPVVDLDRGSAYPGEHESIGYY
jgi:hypothetical protein